MAAAGEWRTVVLAIVVHAGWVTVVLGHDQMLWWVSAAALAVLIAWHGSLQHELLHGHPFRNQHLNDMLGSVPIGLRLAYPVYRRYHLSHHRCEQLTDPMEDAESYYFTADAWRGFPRPARWFWVCHNTLSGRLVLGPACETILVYRWQWREVRAGDRELLRWWLAHLTRVALLLAFVLGVAGFPLWLYLIGAYGGHSLGLMRSFCEHRWVSEDGPHTAVVRAGPFWSLLFLNNNLHVAHHAAPDVAWYRLPALADEQDADASAAAEAGLYRGYAEVFRRFLVRPFDHPLHPQQRPAAVGFRSGRAG